MKGLLLIDGTEVYTSLGIHVTKESHNNLITFLAMKEPDKNDWPEEGGQEFDLSCSALDTAEVSIESAHIGSLGIGGLVDILSGLSYHEFYFPFIDRSYKLCLSSRSSHAINPSPEVAKSIFSNDFPREVDYKYQESINELPMPRGYEIDDKDLSDYSVVVSQGSNAEVLKAPAAKKNLLQNFKRQDRAIYDGEVMKFQTKEASLKRLMCARTVGAFWRNHDALLHDLTELSAKVDDEGYKYPDTEHIFYCDGLGENCPYYYRPRQTNTFMLNNGV